MKTDLLPRQLLLALALIGLMIGCGGNKDTEEKPGETGKGAEEKSAEGGDAKGNGNQSAAKEARKADLATFLTGKRVIVQMPMPPGTPPDAPKPELLFQFEEDGTLTGGMMMNGQAFGIPGSERMYKVADLKVTILKDGKEEGSLTFESANPKKGDKIFFQQSGAAAEQASTISGIENASELKELPQGGPGGPDGPGGLGGPAFGIGPNGEFAKSKHPAFIAHTWKTGPFSKGVKQTATFDKTGALTITLDKGKPIKGTWEVAGPQITLTYPDPATGKEQALKYRFLFGGSELIGDDGKVTEKTEMLMLEGVGKNKTSIAFERTLGP